MDRLSDSRSAGSSRSKKNKRLPLPSQRTETDSGDLLSIISGDSSVSKKVKILINLFLFIIIFI